MMQMVAAAGLPIETDGERAADPDNPETYYEWERIKRVGRRPEILREAAGKAIKVVAPLLGQLSALHSYRAIYMDRPIGEWWDRSKRRSATEATKAPRRTRRRCGVCFPTLATPRCACLSAANSLSRRSSATRI
jgi:hypothetical protein